RPFLIIMMTEPLALVAALLALAFFVEALRLRSPAHALLGFSLLCVCVGLWIRMGSMFTIPIAAAGIPLLFADTMRGRLKLLASAVAILVAIFGINFVLDRDVRVGRQHRGKLCLHYLWSRPWHGLVGVLSDVLCPTL